MKIPSAGTVRIMANPRKGSPFPYVMRIVGANGNDPHATQRRQLYRVDAAATRARSEGEDEGQDEMTHSRGGFPPSRE